MGWNKINPVTWRHERGATVEFHVYARIYVCRDRNGRWLGNETTLDAAWERADRRSIEPHDCWENAVQYTSDGALGHGWECGLCGEFLQAG